MKKKITLGTANKSVLFSKVTLAHLGMFTVALIYAGNYTIAKLIMPKYIAPFPFIFMRVAFGLVSFWITAALMAPKETVLGIDKLRFAACGLFGVAVNQLFFFQGLSFTSPIHASLIMLTTPILVLLMSFLLLGERITLLKAFGILLGLFGAGTLIWNASPENMEAGSRPGLGNVLIAINAASYGIYLILAKPLMKRYHPLTLIKWTFLFGFLFVLPFGGSAFLEIEWAVLPDFGWSVIIYVLLGTTFLTYLLNTFALSIVNPSVVSTYIYLQPLLATTIALLAGKDFLEWPMLVAGAFIFTGVYFVSKPDNKGIQE